MAPGDFSRTNVGDDTDTSPYRAQGVIGISTTLYIRNMGELMRFLTKSSFVGEPSAEGRTPIYNLGIAMPPSTASTWPVE